MLRTQYVKFAADSRESFPRPAKGERRRGGPGESRLWVLGRECACTAGKGNGVRAEECAHCVKAGSVGTLCESREGPHCVRGERECVHTVRTAL